MKTGVKQSQVSLTEQLDQLRELAKGFSLYSVTLPLLEDSFISDCIVYESRKPFVELKKLANVNGYFDAADQIQRFMEKVTFLGD